MEQIYCKPPYQGKIEEREQRTKFREWQKREAQRNENGHIQKFLGDPIERPRQESLGASGGVDFSPSPAK